MNRFSAIAGLAALLGCAGVLPMATATETEAPIARSAANDDLRQRVRLSIQEVLGDEAARLSVGVQGDWVAVVGLVRRAEDVVRVRRAIEAVSGVGKVDTDGLVPMRMLP